MYSQTNSTLTEARGAVHSRVESKFQEGWILREEMTIDDPMRIGQSVYFFIPSNYLIRETGAIEATPSALVKLIWVHGSIPQVKGKLTKAIHVFQFHFRLSRRKKRTHHEQKQQLQFVQSFRLSSYSSFPSSGSGSDSGVKVESKSYLVLHNRS